MACAIRELHVRDIERIGALFNQACEVGESTHGASSGSPDQLLSFLRAPALLGARVAENGNGILGAAVLSRHHEREAYGRTAELSVHVAKHARGEDIGRELARQSIADAAKLGLHSLVMLSFERPHIARLAKTLGFAEAVRLPGAFGSHNTWQDVLVWQRMLEGGDDERPSTPEEVPPRVTPGGARSPSIRRATMSDADDLARIYNQAMKDGIFATSDVQPVDRNNRLAWLERHTDRYPAFVYTGERGRVIAWCALNPFSLRPGYVGIAESSRYVDEAYRGRGLGKEMMAHLIAVGQDLALRSLVALVFSRNVASIRSAQELGSRPVGRLREVAHLRERWLDVVYMHTDLTRLGT